LAEYILFALITVLNVMFSRRWLTNPKAHGLYRFFAFESIAGLILVQADAWFVNVVSIRQLIASLLLSASLMLAIHGFWLLRFAGKPSGNFEETTVLVTRGAYRYIRHPLYCSLLLFTIGTFLKSISVASVLLAGFAGLFLLLTAVVEERENLERFGASYISYRERTRMFIPWLF
jgi:protein-S-isoprenylcysteine O-methyltransferase Ste14